MSKKVEKIKPIPQKIFEGYLELLITYKKLHPKKEVYLTESGIRDAIKWYHTYIKDPKLLQSLIEN